MKMLRALVAGTALLAVAVVALLLYASNPVRSSDHQDSPLTVARPGADITDVFVFPSPHDPSKVVLAMDVWPAIPTGQGPTKFFDPGVMYQFNVGLNDDFRKDVVIQFKADGSGPNQKITMYGPGAPVLQGTISRFIAPTGSVAYNQTGTVGDARVFAGPREDPFYFDLSQFFKILPDRNYKNQPNPPAPTASCFRPRGEAQDFLAGYNVLSLVVELPRKAFVDQNGNLGLINVWASTSLPQSDPAVTPTNPINAVENAVRNASTQAPGSAAGTDANYVQIERLARPAVKEATEDFKNHDITNRSDILDDRTLADSIKAFVMRSPGGAGRSEAVANAIQGVLIPDAIRADLRASGSARYLGVETNGKSGFPIAVIRAVPPSGIYGIKKALGDPYRHFGGRDLKSPVIDLSLGAIFGSLVPKLGLAPEDNRETPCLTSDNVIPDDKHQTGDFPYIGAAQ